MSTNVSSATSSATWLTPTRRTYTSGAPSIMIEVTANTATSNRNCTVTVTAADGNKVIIKVVQKGTSQASDQPQTNDEVSDQQKHIKQKTAEEINLQPLLFILCLFSFKIVCYLFGYFFHSFY